MNIATKKASSKRRITRQMGLRKRQNSLLMTIRGLKSFQRLKSGRLFGWRDHMDRSIWIALALTEICSYIRLQALTCKKTSIRNMLIRYAENRKLRAKRVRFGQFAYLGASSGSGSSRALPTGRSDASSFVTRISSASTFPYTNGSTRMSLLIC